MCRNTRTGNENLFLVVISLFNHKLSTSAGSVMTLLDLASRWRSLLRGRWGWRYRGRRIRGQWRAWTHQEHRVYDTEGRKGAEDKNNTRLRSDLCFVWDWRGMLSGKENEDELTQRVKTLERNSFSSRAQRLLHTRWSSTGPWRKNRRGQWGSTGQCLQREPVSSTTLTSSPLRCPLTSCFWGIRADTQTPRQHWTTCQGCFKDYRCTTNDTRCNTFHFQYGSIMCCN